MPQRNLEELLTSLNLYRTDFPHVLVGVGDDAAVIKLTGNRVLVQHLDFFTPIIDNPYLQGKIAACNTVSDVYSKGATNIVSVLTIMGVLPDMPEDIVKEQVQGFIDLCGSVNAAVVGGQTIYSGWPILGGAATGLAQRREVVSNAGAQGGDILILTKPLGTQPVMATLRLTEAEQQRLERKVEAAKISQAIDEAVALMSTPNKAAAEAMAESNANASTDITGFGLLGHTKILARQSKVDIVIHTLPLISGAVEIARSLKYELERGLCPETSGGLLISVARGEARDALTSALECRGVPAYEVGYALAGAGKASLVAQPTLLEV